MTYLRFIRYRLNMKQKHFAKRCRRSQGYMSEVERGEKKPSPELCGLIADVSGRPVDEVIARLCGANVRELIGTQYETFSPGTSGA